MKVGSTLWTLNVGGRRFSFSPELMKHLPLSRLSRLHRCGSESELLELCDDYDRDRNEFFFDRHAEAFSFIMLYLQHGKLRFVPHMCELSFYNEMLYWGLESSDLLPCCQRRLDGRMSDCSVHFFPEEESRGPEEPQSRWLERLRRTFEEPASSLAAQILASVSVLFVVISMVMLCASTLPDWKASETMDLHRIIEAVCITWFTAECIVRFLVSRDKCEFVRHPLNLIDLLAIMPYYISITVTILTGEDSQLQRAGVTLRILRMMRIFWVIKLARHFLGLQTLGLTLRRCYREMVMLLVFICVAMAIFSALAQLLEHGLDLEAGNQDYASIPSACWWVIISMTTVGYGDMYPVTVAGRVLGAICVVSGIVLLALPITFIYHSFVQCYHELKVRSVRCSRSLSAEFIY
ncbi:potassium voltage-gated channel subfamily G member 3-like [Mugil cephalus]|uniref:potassium voltage-gated channel subfamily G member 3-like n=1 Tax=Mugil cephalus TaxID=48193 RepID=UPI001FB6722C|nr:potassium voltage-gated channel subfamily G member 3-like [Mugil cephalus]XP_047459443.1 potassium voltage-gated channel subfamily G member 3-like [Mugil cephalus]XP_047459445.1 potassium voltage-gated channel subfamily G member 3-like [Mugil cephalus]